MIHHVKQEILWTNVSIVCLIHHLFHLTSHHLLLYIYIIFTLNNTEHLHFSQKFIYFSYSFIHIFTHFFIHIYLIHLFI